MTLDQLMIIRSRDCTQLVKTSNLQKKLDSRSVMADAGGVLVPHFPQ